MMWAAILAERLNQQERVDALRRWSGGGRTGGEGDPWASVLWIVVVAAVVIGFIYVASSVRWKRGRKPPNDRGGLFKAAMSHLRLDFRTRSLISRIASDRRLEHPVQLLMSPKLFDEITESWLSALPPEENRRQLPLLKEARARIYSGTTWQSLKDMKYQEPVGAE